VARSYRSPKTTIAVSAIEGRGLFATRAIRKGEIVAIKGGHVFDRATVRRHGRRLGVSYIQVDDDHFIGALSPREIGRNKLFINHSCEPNVGIRGQITFVAMRDVRAGEELTYDWAMEEDSADRTRCLCRAASCRGTITGRDWKHPALQRRYRGYFSAYLQAKIDHLRARRHGRR
jgi:uncharacterized protein